MKKRSLLSLVFLMFLYIGPLIFTVSDGHTAILAEQNIGKDFTTSANGDESPQSITSFSETLPDDVLFYPDGLLIDSESSPTWGGLWLGDASDGTEGNLFYSGADSQPDEDGAIETGISYSGTYPSISFVLDLTVTAYSKTGGTTSIDIGVMLWSGVGSGSEDLIFTQELTGTGAILVTGETSLTAIESFLVNITYAGAPSGDYVNITIDSYQYEYQTVLSADSYAESFADISDWTNVDGTITSNGDVGAIEALGDDAYDSAYTDVPSYPSGAENYYIEFRHKENTTTGAYCLFQLLSSDGGAGTNRKTISFTESTSWTTEKFIINVAGSIESIKWFVRASVPIKAELDYLRIAPADELGWQHDGSTTSGIITTYNCTVTSDGDQLNVTGTDGAYGYIEIDIDPTTTRTYIEETYYPFIEMNITSVQAVGNAGLPRLWGGDGTQYIPSATWFTSAGMIRANIIAGSSGDPYLLRLYVVTDASYLIDYVKIYSIANFTYSDYGCAITEYLYVDSGVLSGISDTEMVLQSDNDFSVNTADYNTWNITATNTASLRFDYYVGGWQTGTYGITGGALVSGTLTILKFRIGNAATGTIIISAIKFIDTHLWQEAAEVTIILVVPISAETLWALNNLYILLGMIFVISSGLYLVKGGRDEFSLDKTFFVIVAFIFGWALIIGGIMP